MIFKKKEKNDSSESQINHIPDNRDEVNWKSKDDSFWKQNLSPLQYKVTRQKGTEHAGTGFYSDSKDSGTYCCSNCGNKLFQSDKKFDSGTGWPSFFDFVANGSISLREDNSLFAKRVEVLCGDCDAHLGHVFDDGPQPTGKRYCMNSVSMYLKDTSD